jgi:hypothetical protein
MHVSCGARAVPSLGTRIINNVTLHMARSYHVTRKKADAAMNRGDMGPTWQASEKAAVKKREVDVRTLSKLARRKVGPTNRAIVAREKDLTRRSLLKGAARVNARLDGFLRKNDEA